MDNHNVVKAPLGVTISEAFVPIGYVMNPADEDLIRGENLRDGMVVLIEDILVRDAPDTLGEKSTPYAVTRVLAASRWCKVTQLKQGSIVSFVGVYGDGTKMSRAYSDRYFWLVKY